MLRWVDYFAVLHFSLPSFAQCANLLCYLMGPAKIVDGSPLEEDMPVSNISFPKPEPPFPPLLVPKPKLWIISEVQ